MKIYYAHCMTIYNTPQEKRDISLLGKLGFEVINPNHKGSEEAYQRDGMNYFIDLVKGSDALAFRSFPNGEIPAGVYKEIEVMKKKGSPVFELPSGLIGRRISVEQTREYLEEVGYR